jgi:hypothetical protein
LGHCWLFLLRRATNDVWVERLAEEDPVSGMALDDMVGILNIPAGNGGSTGLSPDERVELRAQWKDFFAKHGKEIKAGKTFSIDDPDVTIKLAGKSYWYLKDGTTWPKKQK